MKRLVLLLSFILVSTIVFSQKTALEKTLFKVPQTSYIYQYTGATRDTLGAVQDSILIPLYIECPNPTYYDFKVRIHENVSACNVAVQLKGKKYSTDTYTTITTLTYKGVGTDTTLLFTQVSTLQHYNYYQLVFKRVANKAKITDIVGVFKR